MAPDYVLVTNGRQEALVEAFRKNYATFYPKASAGSSSVTSANFDDSFSRIAAHRHFDRLKGLLDETKGEVVLGGSAERENKFIAPTVVKDVGPDDSLMSQLSVTVSV